MPLYSYMGRDSEGRAVGGQVDAPTIAEAIKQIDVLKIEIHSIGMADAVSAGNRIASQSMELPATSVALIDAALTQCVDLLPALESAIAEAPKSISVSACNRLAATLRTGLNTNELIRDPWLVSYLPLLLRNVDAKSNDDGAADANAANVLRGLSADIGARRLSIQLFLYPIALIAITVTLLVLLLIFIVPVFHRMYLEFGLELPAPTRFICSLSDRVMRHPVRLFGLFVTATALVIGAIVMWRRYSLSNLFFGSFIAGSSANLMAMSRFTAALAELLRIGVALGDAILLAGRVSGHRYFQVVAKLLSEEVGNSDQIPRDSNYALVFPATVLHALQLPTNGQSRIQLLRQLSDIYRQRVEYRFGFLSSYFGPVTIIVLGGAIGFVIIALFQPLVSMISSLA